MESYYSSDEEIAWGPITLREIKSDLKRPVIRKPNRRHTVLCNIQNSCKMNSSSPSSHETESLAEDINKLNISKASTAYYTPNESLRTNRNSDFLEKLSHVINIPTSELSEYASVLNDSVNSSNRSENISGKKETLNIPNIFQSDGHAIGHNDSSTNFIKVLENRKTHYEIEKFQQTLVENTYVLSEGDDDISSEQESIANHENSLHREENKLITEEEVILISDDDSSVTSNREDVDDNITTFKKEINFEEHEKQYVEHNDSEYQSYDNSENSIKSEEQLPDDSNKIGDVINICEENDDIKVDEIFRLPNVQPELYTINESFSTSPVIVPEIDLSQFDDSVTKDDLLQLNDTLEEMNRLLCQGLNYSMSDDEVIDSTPAKKEAKAEQPFTPADIISGSFTLSKQQLFSGSKEKKSHIPKRNFGQTSTEKKQINTHTVNKSSPKINFKVPDLPLRPKLTNPTTPKSCRNHLKNVISPVALYIKNSPRVPLKKNVPQRELPRIATTNTTSANKENFPEFPEVIYTPSKKQISSTEKHIIVPPYLRKLNIKEGHITKHEGRIKHELDRSKVSKKLLETDITSSTIDQSLLDNSGDISVLTNKQAFIK